MCVCMHACADMQVAIALPLSLGMASGLSTRNQINTWYARINKPTWTPPNWCAPGRPRSPAREPHGMPLRTHPARRAPQWGHDIPTRTRRLFGPVWTCLYLSMGVASYMVYRQGGWAKQAMPLGLYVAQLALNLLW